MISIRISGPVLSLFCAFGLLVTASGSDFANRGIPTAIKAVAEEENKSPVAIQSSDKTDLEGGGVMTISIQPRLHVGERASLEIVTTADSHVRVYHFSSDEHTTELFPGNTGLTTKCFAHKKLTVSWETTPPGGLEHVLVYVSKGEITNTAKGTVAGDFKVYKTEDVYSSRGIPVAIQSKEIEDKKTTTTSYTSTYEETKKTTTYEEQKKTTTYEEPKVKAKLLHARLCYELKEY